MKIVIFLNKIYKKQMSLQENPKILCILCNSVTHTVKRKYLIKEEKHIFIYVPSAGENYL